MRLGPAEYRFALEMTIRVLPCLLTAVLAFSAATRLFYAESKGHPVSRMEDFFRLEEGVGRHIRGQAFVAIGLLAAFGFLFVAWDFHDPGCVTILPLDWF